MNASLPTGVATGRLAVASRHLVKMFGKVKALSGVDLQVPEGAFYLLAGPNGAGKSTLIEILMGRLEPDRGKAEVFGQPTGRAGANARACIGYVPSAAGGGYEWMTVGQLMRHHSRYFNTWDADYAARLVSSFSLPLEHKVGGLSKGFARRVQLVLALAHRPPLLLLDEPTDGLDRVARDELMGILAEHMADTPTTVLVSTHLIHEFETLADHLGVLRDGKLFAQVSRDALQQSLRRYRVEVPVGWTAPAELRNAAITISGGEREATWVVCGESSQVVTQFTWSGANVREVQALSLDDAVLALLRPTKAAAS